MAMIALYVDCTSTFKSTFNTGIQRTVRLLVPQLTRLGEEFGFVVCPTIRIGHKYYQISNLMAEGKPDPSRLLHRLRKMFSSLDAFIMSHADRSPGHRSVGSSQALLMRARNHIEVLIRKLENTVLMPFMVRRMRRVYPKKGDIHLQLDAFWHEGGQSEAFRQRKELGVHNVMVLYDLIPLDFPDHFYGGTVERFRDAIDRGAPYCDLIVAISQTVAERVRAELRKNFVQSGVQPGVDFFYLGSEVPASAAEATVTDAFAVLTSQPFFLVVGTIEPRKRIDLVLDAFDEYWTEGGSVRLVLAGKQGWMVESILRRIGQHPRRDKQLFYLGSIPDRDLAHLYQKCIAVIAASDVEGFDLPLVEAMACGRPVIASDIPVHREIGGDQINYFDQGSSHDLSRLLRREDLVVPDKKFLDRYRWDQSARRLLEIIHREVIRENRTRQLTYEGKVE